MALLCKKNKKNACGVNYSKVLARESGAQGILLVPGRCVPGRCFHWTMRPMDYTSLRGRTIRTRIFSQMNETSLKFSGRFVHFLDRQTNNLFNLYKLASLH
jgi:hypothetical protein